MIALKAGIAAAIMTLAVVGNTAAMEGDMFLWPGRGGDGDYENGIKAARAGDWQLSLHYLNRSVGRDPQDADALALLAISHRKLGRFDQAMRLFDAALAIEPDHRLAHFHVGSAYLAGGNLMKARKHEATLTVLCPKGCPELGALKRAIADFKKRDSGS
ncbi:MAG: tetratricopeptide repeat protein [Alphaproteobacteria bacterium]|nr:tetratricopeptide repeat protein [Alphaproteobacteria bacterium]